MLAPNSGLARAIGIGFLLRRNDKSGLGFLKHIHAPWRTVLSAHGWLSDCFTKMKIQPAMSTAGSMRYAIFSIVRTSGGASMDG